MSNGPFIAAKQRCYRAPYWWWAVPVLAVLLREPARAQSATPWPVNTRTGAVEFTGTNVLPRPAAGPASAHGLGACLEDWFAEQFPQAQVPQQLPQWGADSTWLKVGGLPGHHPSVALTFIFLARMDRPGHYRYRLYHCRVAATTGEGLIQESALERVLDDKDFLPDVTLFHQRLTNSLAHLPGRVDKQH